MANIVYFPIAGEGYSGKSTIIKKVIDHFLCRDDINIFGFTQPTQFVDGEKVGYDLSIIRNNKTVDTFNFATFNPYAPMGQIPYSFNEELFDSVYNEAALIKNDGKPVLLIFDEIGGLELSGKGHGKTINKCLEMCKNAEKICLITTCNTARYSKMKSYFEQFNIAEGNEPLRTPVTDLQVEDFISSVEKYILINKK